MQVRWFQVNSGCISTTITLTMTVCNIFQSKHAAINDMYEQFNTACQWRCLYILVYCRHNTCLHDCVWFVFSFIFLLVYWRINVFISVPTLTLAAQALLEHIDIRQTDGQKCNWTFIHASRRSAGVPASINFNDDMIKQSLVSS